MNINKDILNELLADPKKIESISIESLEDLAIEFPYFIGIQKLINTKRKQIDENENDTLIFIRPDEKTDQKNANNNFDKEEEEEFTELEIEEKELPFEDIEEKILTENKLSESTTSTLKEPINNKLTAEQTSTLQSLAGSPINYSEDDLSLLPHLTAFDIENLSNVNIITYQQLVNLNDRNGLNIFMEAFQLSKEKYDTITDQAIILHRNKYQKLIIEELGFAQYNNKNDFKRINGIGEFLEKKLNKTGIFTFNQLANLDEKNAKILTHLIDYFPGRIERDNWQQQAKSLIDVVNADIEVQKPTATIEHLAEKLAFHKSNKNSNETLSRVIKDDKKNEEGQTKSFLSWLSTFDKKKHTQHLETNKDEIMNYVEEEQPRLVKVNENNLNEIHTFLGNKAEDFQPLKPVFEFLPGFSVKEVAAKSLNEDQSIVSITLAKIYEQQQYFDKAIKIYQKLILKYPEKSGFFAGRIKNLEGKI